MTDMQREALAVLAEVWKLSPDVRLGQLMSHLEFLADAHLGKGLGSVEDDELIAVLYRHRGELKARLEGVPTQTPPSTAVATSVSGSSTLPEAAPAAQRPTCLPTGGGTCYDTPPAATLPAPTCNRGGGTR